MRSPVILLLCLIGLFSCGTSPKDKSEEKLRPGKTKKERTYEVSGINTLNDTGDVNKLLRKGNNVVKTNPDSAISAYLDALERCKNIDYPEGRVIAFNNLACCYQKKGDYKTMAFYNAKLKKGLNYIPGPYFDPKRHRKLLGQKYTYKAAAYYESGNYDSASLWYLKTSLLLKSPDSVTYNALASTYLGLGAISARMSNPTKALDYFNQASLLAAQYGDSALLVTVLTNKATLLVNNNDYAAARNTAEHAIGIAQRSTSNSSIALLANTIAISFIKEHKPEQALPYSKMVQQAAEQKHSDLEKISAYYILGYNYVELKQYNIAKNYLLKGLKVALAINNNDNIANAYEQLAAACEGMGQYSEALEYQKKYTAVRDNLLGRESTGRIAEIETKYRVAQKDNELARKDKALLQTQLKIASQQKRQYLWIGGAFLCIVILLGLLRQKRYKTKLNRLKDTIAGEEKERRRLAQELHDGIVSRLSIIKMNFSALPQQYEYLNDAAYFREVVEQLEQSIIELRTTSHNLLPEILKKAGLCESIRIYCDKIRKVAMLDIEFQLLGELPPLTDDFQLNIYRIIQELVNNIVKHSNASHALIQFQLKDEWLNITIDDNGSGTPEAETSTTGIGLQNLHDRIRLLNGTIETEKGKGTSVYLEFNLRKYIR